MTKYTEAQAKAIKKYFHESIEEFKVRFPKGDKQIVKDHAASQGESMNAFILRAIKEAIQNDKNKLE